MVKTERVYTSFRFFLRQLIQKVKMWITLERSFFTEIIYSNFTALIKNYSNSKQVNMKIYSNFTAFLQL